MRIKQLSNRDKKMLKIGYARGIAIGAMELMSAAEDVNPEDFGDVFETLVEEFVELSQAYMDEIWLVSEDLVNPVFDSVTGDFTLSLLEQMNEEGFELDDEDLDEDGPKKPTDDDDDLPMLFA